MNWTELMIAIKKGLIPSKKELVDGTTKVGKASEADNADKLDGHDAEYFAPLSRINGDYLTTSILEKALTAPLGISEYKLGGDGYNGGDLPHYGWTYSTAIVYKRATNSIVVMLVCELYDRTLINRYGGTTWTGWVESANTADLAKYLPLTGGKIVGSVSLQGTTEEATFLQMGNPNRTLQQIVYPNGNLVFYDYTNNQTVFDSTVDGRNSFNGTASENLPLDGNTPLNGNTLGISQNRGSVNADDAHVGLKTHTTKGDTENYRYLMVLNASQYGTADIGSAIFLRDCVNGYKRNYMLHHDGNSAKVHIGTSAPSDTSALWVY